MTNGIICETCGSTPCNPNCSKIELNKNINHVDAYSLCKEYVKAVDTYNNGDKSLSLLWKVNNSLIELKNYLS